MHTRGSHKAHEEKQISTPFLIQKSVYSLTRNKIYLLTYSRVHNEKDTFLLIFECFDRFQPCECMRKHAFTG